MKTRSVAFALFLLLVLLLLLTKTSSWFTTRDTQDDENTKHYQMNRIVFNGRV